MHSCYFETNNDIENNNTDNENNNKNEINNKNENNNNNDTNNNNNKRWFRKVWEISTNSQENVTDLSCRRDKAMKASITTSMDVGELRKASMRRTFFLCAANVP